MHAICALDEFPSAGNSLGAGRNMSSSTAAAAAASSADEDQSDDWGDGDGDGALELQDASPVFGALGLQDSSPVFRSAVVLERARKNQVKKTNPTTI